MKTPSAVIADDEEILRAGLRRMLDRLWPKLRIIGEAADGNQAVSLIESLNPDIAFLDINMPGMTGIDVARKVYNQTKVIFVTAYDQYAVQAFESEAVDYVLKPVEEKRLETTIERLKKRLNPEQADPGLETRMKKIFQVIENQAAPQRTRLIKVKTGTDVRFVPVAQILYFKAEDKYTTVRTVQKEFLIKTPIKTLANELDPDQFWRVHRSAIVNIDKIHKIKRSFTNQMIIAFTDIDDTIAVSRAFEHLFK